MKLAGRVVSKQPILAALRWTAILVESRVVASRAHTSVLEGDFINLASHFGLWGSCMQSGWSRVLQPACSVFLVRPILEVIAEHWAPRLTSRFQKPTGLMLREHSVWILVWSYPDASGLGELLWYLDQRPSKQKPRIWRRALTVATGHKTAKPDAKAWDCLSKQDLEALKLRLFWI